MPVGAHDPRRERADHRQPALVGVDQYELGDLDVPGQPGNPVDKLGGVGGPAADHRKLHPKAFTSAPARATWQATS